MVTSAKAERRSDGWYVVETWGGTILTHGPYRIGLLAKFIAWLNDGYSL